MMQYAEFDPEYKQSGKQPSFVSAENSCVSACSSSLILAGQINIII